MGDGYRDADASTSLYGRRSECAVLDGLLERVRGGRSAVLVMGPMTRQPARQPSSSTW